MIDPEALRALAAIAATGSVAGAADRLGYTPSAVSQQVKRLAAQVGVPLLARAGRGVVLTAAGEALVGRAPEVFAAMERATEAARRRTGDVTGTLRLAAFSTSIRGLVAPALARLRADHPALDVVVDELDPGPARAAVAAGAADLGIVHDSEVLPGPPPPGLRHRPLLDDVGDVAVRADHPLAERPVVTGADLAGCAWVTSPPGTACHDWFLALVADAGGRADVRHRVDDFSTQLALVAAAGVVALIPRLARPPVPPDLRVVRVEPAPVRRVEALWRAASDDSPALHAVLAALTR